MFDNIRIIITLIPDNSRNFAPNKISTNGKCKRFKKGHQLCVGRYH